MTSVSLMHEAPKAGAWDNLEEQGRERSGKEIQDWGDIPRKSPQANVFQEFNVLSADQYTI